MNTGNPVLGFLPIGYELDGSAFKENCLVIIH